MPTDVAKIRREHVEAYLADVADHWAPSTVQTRYKGCRLFFAYLAEEGEVDVSPMANIHPPTVPEVPVPVLAEDQLKSLLATCAGKGFEARRDTALVRLFLDTGARRAEVANLTLEELDFETDVILVVGKGRRPRACPSAPRRPWPSTVTYGSDVVIPTQPCPGSGWARKAVSATPASPR